MPALNYLQTGALGCSFDLSHLAGEDLWTDALGTVEADADFGRFNHIYDLLNGLANDDLNDRSWAAAINAAAVVAGLVGTVFTVGIDATDKVFIASATNSFTVAAPTAGNAFGYATSNLSSTAVGGVDYATAPNNWVRGVVTGAILGIRITVGVTTFTVTADPGNHQGVPEFIRPSSTSDDEISGAATTNLSFMANQQYGAGTTRLLLNDSGRVEIWRVVGSDAFTWESTELRDILGCTGTESVVTNGSYRVITATYPPRYTLWLNRAVEYCEPKVFGLRHSSEASDGRVESAHLLTKKGWDVKFEITGLSSNYDMLAEALDDFLLYLWQAEHFTVFRNTKERRKAVRTRLGYSLEVCGEDNYGVGATRLTLDSSIDQMRFQLEDVRQRHSYHFEISGWEYVA